MGWFLSTYPIAQYLFSYCWCAPSRRFTSSPVT